MFRPFSIIVYNESFTQKREYNFSDSINHLSIHSIMTNEGLIMQINEGNFKKQKFRLYEFN